jgi:hypothetical protein
MRTILLTLVIAALTASTALAQQVSPHKPDKPVSSGKLLPVEGAASRNSCAAFGPGFVKVEGSDSCVKIGGATSIGGGTSGGGR